MSWIARVEADDGTYRLILLSSFECDRLLSTFRRSDESSLYMYRPRLCDIHNDLTDNRDLRVSGRANTVDISEDDSAQIKMFSGAMYFRNETEQNAYCNFLGLIPRPRTSQQNDAFEKGLIKPNGFVPPEHRHELAEFVGKCTFEENPIIIARRLIEAHHGYLRKGSNVASILERGIKQVICDETLAEEFEKIYIA